MNLHRRALWHYRHWMIWHYPLSYPKRGFMGMLERFVLRFTCGRCKHAGGYRRQWCDRWNDERLTAWVNGLHCGRGRDYAPRNSKAQNVPAHRTPGAEHNQKGQTT